MWISMNFFGFCDPVHRPPPHRCVFFPAHESAEGAMNADVRDIVITFGIWLAIVAVFAVI
jgi:hypothetical protein